MDKYEKLYNEALERFKSFKEKYYTKDTNLGDVIFDKNGEMQKDFNGIFPELRVSEDDRIINAIIGILKNSNAIDINVSQEKMFAWLEKQKYDRMKPIYDARESFESALAKAWKDYDESGARTVDSCEDDYVECAHAKGFREGFLYGLEKQKEQKVDIDKEKLIRHCIGLILTDATDERFKDYGLTLKDCLTWLGEQKEQKPTSTEDMPYITDEHFYEREPADSFKYKLAEYMTKCCTKKEGPDGYTYGISAETILKMAGEELLKRGVLQKPVKWKPQPESLEALMYAIEGKWDMIKPTSYLSRRLEDLYEGLVNTYNVDETHITELPKTTYTAKDKDELRALKDKIDSSMDEKPSEWGEEDEKFLEHCSDILDGCGEPMCALRLKSLRPSWKPSEEQMEAFKNSVEHIPNAYYDDMWELYEQLKKLM